MKSATPSPQFSSLLVLRVPNNHQYKINLLDSKVLVKTSASGPVSSCCIRSIDWSYIDINDLILRYKTLLGKNIITCLLSRHFKY